MSTSVDFFVSYNKADLAWAEWIAWQLETEGYTVRIQAWDFRAGSNFIHEMQTAASLAERTIAVLSPDYLESRFTAPEWYAAFANDPTGEKRTLVPVRVRRCDLEGLLPQIVYIDLVDLDAATAKPRLMQGVKPGRAKPSVEPSYPGHVVTSPKPETPEPRFPGQLPVVFQVPHLRNLQFTGRAELLTDLHTALTANQTAAIVQAVHGMGGVGKTQTAVEYCYRYGHAYDGVWWLNSESPDVLRAGLAELALAVKAATVATDPGTAVAAALRWLRNQKERWLIVYDNATSPQAIREQLPQIGGCRVLLTSRHPHWDSVGTMLQVRPWKRSESVGYIQLRTGLNEPISSDELSQELGDLPLALAQATGYMRETACSIATYLKLYRERRQELWSQETAPTDYGQTIAATWSVALEALSQTGADLLRLCAFMAPEPIPWEILRKKDSSVPTSLKSAMEDDLTFNRTKKELTGFSLAEITPSALTVHRLLQAVVRDSLDEIDTLRWRGAASVVSISDFEPSEDHERLESLRLQIPHLLKALSESTVADQYGEVVGYLLHNAGEIKATNGENEDAKVLLRRAISIKEKVYPPEHFELAKSYSQLASLEKAAGNLQEARELTRKVITCMKSAKDMPEILLTCANRILADIEWKLGNLHESRRLFDHILSTTDESVDEKKIHLPSTLGDSAMVEMELNNPTEAKRRLELSISIQSARNSTHTSHYEASYILLAFAEQTLGNTTKALSHYRFSLDALKKRYAEGHESIRVLENIISELSGT